jgi:hypothetical protein
MILGQDSLRAERRLYALWSGGQDEACQTLE